MDRGWHPAACSGLERPRVGQQPYDRGRGMPIGRRTCYGCGQDGHIRSNCPNLDKRYGDSERVMDRSIPVGDGRWGHDSWGSSRIAPSGGRDYGNSRADSIRESSSSRRGYFDYYDNGDFGHQRSRDLGDRHRDNDVRGHGVVTGQRKDGQETTLKEAILSASGQRKDRPERTLKEAILSASAQRKDGQESVGKEPILSSLGQKKDRPESIAKEPILSSSSQKKDRPESNAKEPILSSSGQKKDCSESIAKDSVLSVSGERKDGQERVVKEPILSPLYEDKIGLESTTKKPILTSSSEGKDGPERVTKQSILSLLGERKDAPEGVIKELILSSSGEKTDAPGSLTKEPILSLLGESKDAPESVTKELILPSSGQREDGSEGNTKDPILSSSGQGNGGPEANTEESVPSSLGQAEAGTLIAVKEMGLSSSGQRKDGSESTAKETILSSSGHRPDGPESNAKEIIPSSLSQREEGPESAAKDSIASSSGQRIDGIESIIKEPTLSSSGQRKDGLDRIIMRVIDQESMGEEPILSSTGGGKPGQENALEKIVDIKLDCLFPRRGEKCTVTGKDIEVNSTIGKDPEVTNLPASGRKCDRDGKNGKDSAEGKVLYELLTQPDVHVVPGLDSIHAKGNETGEGVKRVLGFGIELDNAHARDLENSSNLSKRDSTDPAVCAAEVSERIRPPASAEQDPETQLMGTGGFSEDSHDPGKITSTSEWSKHPKNSEDDTSGRYSSQRSSRELEEDAEKHCRPAEEDYNHTEGNSHILLGGTDPNAGVEEPSARDSYRERTENMTYSRPETPGRGRHHSRDRDNSIDRHVGWSIREGSTDRNWDRYGYSRNGRTGLKAEYRFHGYDDGYDKAENFGFHVGDDRAEHHWWRHPRMWGAPPGHCLYRRGSYLDVCNARYYRLRRGSLSPPSRHNAIYVDSVSPSRHFEGGYNNGPQSQGTGWMHHESQGSLLGPVVLTQVEELVDNGQNQSGCTVQQVGNENPVTRDHARSTGDPSIVSLPPEFKQQSVPRSLMPSEEPVQRAPPGEELPPLEQGKTENSDRDICPPGTEAHGAASVDEHYEDYHIDERVDKLMQGRTLIPGKERDIVHEALLVAMQRIQQEYELDIAVEESPRSHGGFADIGDQWKDGEFGSEVQGLEGFGFDQQITKVDAKPEETGVGARSEGGTEVASAHSEPTPRPRSAAPHPPESQQELWKWPSRGGDWKVYVVDSVQHMKGETHHLRKLVMNGGHPLCGSKSRSLRDPRKLNQESGRNIVAEPIKLQVPKFALKPILPKRDGVAEYQDVTFSQHSVMVLKGAVTPKSQGSTPRAHVSTPAKNRSSGLAAGVKVIKSGKSSSIQGLPTGTGIKSAGHAKQLRPNLKIEVIGNVQNSSVTDKPAHVQLLSSDADGQLKFSSDHTIDAFDRKSKPVSPDGSLATLSGYLELQGSNAELPRSTNATSLKKLFMGRSLPEAELDSEGHNVVMKLNIKEISVAEKELSEKWSEAKESSVITTVGVPVSPALSVLTPAALNIAPSTMLHLSVADGFHDTPKHEIPLFDHSTEQASSSVYDRPRDNDAGMMEVKVYDGHDRRFADAVSFRLKRKAVSSVEEGELLKQRQRSKHNRLTLGKEENGIYRKPALLSPLTQIRSSMSPLVEDPGSASKLESLEAQDQVEHKVHGQRWGALKPSILYSVFRSLRGDLKTLVNAMATCKSWMAAGERFKTQLKWADLSTVHEQSIDAVLESLPGFGAGKLRRVNLKGCNVSPESLEHLLRACPSISAVEIGYDEPFKEIFCSFPNVRWLGDQSGVQSPKEAPSRKREAKHMKTRSLKVIGVSRHRLRESSCTESEMHPVSDGASKARSPDGYTMEETDINESYQDSAVTHSSVGVKLLKFNNGGADVKSTGVNGSMKAVKQENGNSVSRLHQLKRKAPSGSLRRQLDTVSYRMLKPVTGGQRLLADKHSSTSVKLEHQSKTSIPSLFEGEKTLEKGMRLILSVILEADSEKLLQPATLAAVDGNGVTPVSAKALDLFVIERKLKGGAYAGGLEGFKAFKDDVNFAIRTTFKKKITFAAGVKMFKLAHHQFTRLERQIAGISPSDYNHQGRLSGSRSLSKVGRSGLKPHSMLQHGPKKKRKEWDDHGVQKGKSGVVKKGRFGDSSSGDVDSDSDSTEYAARKASKLKEQSWESEVDSSEEDDEPTFMEEDEEETETEASDSDVPSESEGEDGIFEEDMYYTDDEMPGSHSLGARMTKAAMVPPVTRKYAVIEEYKIVADKERVEQKMKVKLPKDYEKTLEAEKDQRVDNYSHLDIPETRDYRPRKKLGEEVLEQEVYGIDPYTHNLLWYCMPKEDAISGFSDSLKQQFIEERLLLALNREARQFNGTGKAPMEYNLERVVERIIMEAVADCDWALRDFSEQLLNEMRHSKKKFVAYRKGLGVVCNKDAGLEKDEFVVEFFGEVYPPWRWYEKQDGIRSIQKKDKDTAPEFYNIVYERPKGDAAGYDLLVVDAMHKANFASRLCHSCRPNCEAKITAVNDKYIIGVYTLKPIKRGEELTFDYNSVTESKEEYNNAVCLCGSQGCRGSYLNLTGSGTFEEVLLKQHGLLDRHRLLLDSCSATFVGEEGLKEMRQAGLGTCLLSGLPPWVLEYAAGVVRFMNIEKALLPAELLKDLELKVQQGLFEGCTEENAEITTEGVYNQRLQNLAITLDKVRHILTKIYKNPSVAPPPLRTLDKKDMVQWIWKRDDSVVNELLQCLAPHLPKETMSEFTQSIVKQGPHDSGTNLMESLLWLRDELRRLPATCKARHDAAADLIHIYAFTKHFFIAEDYAVVESNPMEIHPLDLGSSKNSSYGARVWHKTYSREYVWGQLIGWYKQSVADPGAGLAKAARGCLTLPDVSSCYAKSMQHDFRQGYGQKHRQKMISHMEEKPQQKWPTSKPWSQFWCFKSERGLCGSPMLDSVLEDKPLDDHLLRWLKTREDVFVGPWDEQ